MGRRLGPRLVGALVFLTCALLVGAPDPPRTHAQQAPIYIAIGDSLSFGVGASESNQTGFVARVHDALESSDRFEDTGIDLRNLSVPGATSPDLLEPGGQLQLALSEIARSDVQLITVDIGGNDLLDLADPDSPCLTELAADPCLDALGDILSDLQTNLGQTLDDLREAAPSASIVVVDLYNPFSGTQDIRELIADAGVQRLNGVIGASAADPDLNVELATVFQLFQGRGNQWISDDNIHPNDDGHAVIAEVVLATLDDREPQISEELLSVPPDPVAVLGAPSPSNGDDGIPVLVLIIAVVAAFTAGAIVTGVFFIVRGS